MSNSPLTASIHVLDDDCHISVFSLYRPFIFGEDDGEDDRFSGGEGRWIRGRWWYKLAHVCQRWRNVVLGSAAYLGVSLVCAEGTPVADMLAHSPPLPLTIDYSDEDEFTAEDESGAILALKQYNRVLHVRLLMPITILQKLIVVMDEEYPILEYLIIMHLAEDKTAILMFPETLRAPHLRHLALMGIALPIGSRLLVSAVELVTLCLGMIYPSTYFHANTLLRWLSFMPQLETLGIVFLFIVPNRDVERQLTHTSTMVPIILPNLTFFRFRGVKTYLETLVHRLTAPRLEMLRVDFFNQLTFSLPRLLQFADTSYNTDNFMFDCVKFKFSNEDVNVEMCLLAEAKTHVLKHALSIIVNCCHLDWQVSSAAQISNLLSPMFSAVEHLTLEYRVHDQSSEEHNEVGRTEWHKLFSSLSNVKTLDIADGLVEELSHCLELDDGELPLEVLPELQELTYFVSDSSSAAFTSFVDGRQNAGHSISLVRRDSNSNLGWSR